MKIDNIKSENGIYTVSLVPNRLEKFFGIKPKVKRYKDSGCKYTFGDNSYISENGKKTANGDWIAESINHWKRKF